ncbi:TraB/GumN family protein [Cecembia lonarensis]|uniref:TraB family protein n=1 Tax=Cecembia lonarensis (strain CCUG 58316 / KCTC 22772 / LW9) TaxID=1225176 RepID=K1L955_CECL9|nr:TraB/GumN family protein [Cecembia lonarensis]EKB51186.1 TraB family protein [Cecembia lonarensis LW9]
MKKYVFIIASIFFIFNVQAQESTLLWKVSGNGLESPSYLFGTMHILCDQSIVEKTSFKEALSQSKYLVMELNPTNPAILQEMQQLAVNPEFENIYTELPEEDFILLDTYLSDKFGAGLAQMGVLKPFTLTSMVTMGFLECEVPFSLETYLAGFATEKEMPVIDLETAAFQVGIFDNIPVDFQIQEIIRSLKDDAGKKELDQMMEIYVSGDLERLYGFMKTSDLMNQYQAEILDNRNRAWIPTLEELFKQGASFVAVGAGHLPGELGVIALLQQKGYSVEAVAL